MLLDRLNVLIQSSVKVKTREEMKSVRLGAEKNFSDFEVIDMASSREAVIVTEIIASGEKVLPFAGAKEKTT